MWGSMRGVYLFNCHGKVHVGGHGMPINSDESGGPGDAARLDFYRILPFDGNSIAENGGRIDGIGWGVLIAK